MADNDNYSSRYNLEEEKPLLSDESKAKAASLIDFINSVKESSAYMEPDEKDSDSEASANEEYDETADEQTDNEDTDISAEATEVIDEEDSSAKETDEAQSADIEPNESLSDIEEVEPSHIEDKSEEADEEAADNQREDEKAADTEENTKEALHDTEAADIEIDSEVNNVFKETDKALSAESDDIKETSSDFNEDAFNVGFHPSFAFYDEEDETPSAPAVEQDKSDAFKRTSVKPKVKNETQQPEKKKDNKDNKRKSSSLLAVISKKSNTPAKKGSKKNEAKETVKDRPASTADAKQPKKPKKKKTVSIRSPKRVAAAAIVAICIVGLLITGGVMAAKGFIPAFATEDIYGAFVDGRLVVASNVEGKIEEAINDFLSYYRVLETQGSISNLRFSNNYEVRLLTDEEVEAGIYTGDTTMATTAATTESTTQAATEATTQSTEANNGTDSVTNQTTVQTTAATEAVTEQTTTVMTDAEGNVIQVTTNQSHPLNKYDDKIAVCQNTDEIKNILFYGSVPKHYTVVEGDNLSKIAKRENLTLTELMVPNPDLLEDSTIGIDQEIIIVKMSGPLKLSFTREVTFTEDIAYETVEEKTSEMYVGETRVIQEGKEGIRQEVTKYDYEYNVIAVRTPISDEVLEEPTKKIVQVGTKKKTSANQSSGKADSGSSSGSASSGFRWPVTGARLSSKFGRRSAPTKGASSYHRGIDLAISKGTPIYATKSGTVTISSYVGGYGNLVEINHGGGFTSRYGHCSKLAVKRGQKVNKGDVIAYVGNTGVSTGPHLHFEIRKNGTAVNPLNYLS